MAVWLHCSLNFPCGIFHYICIYFSFENKAKSKYTVRYIRLCTATLFSQGCTSCLKKWFPFFYEVILNTYFLSLLILVSVSAMRKSDGRTSGIFRIIGKIILIRWIILIYNNNFFFILTRRNLHFVSNLILGDISDLMKFIYIHMFLISTRIFQTCLSVLELYLSMKIGTHA